MYLLYQSSQPLAFLCWKQLVNALKGPLVPSKRDNDLGPAFLQRGFVHSQALRSQERLCALALRAMRLLEASYVWVYLRISALLPHRHVAAVKR